MLWSSNIIDFMMYIRNITHMCVIAKKCPQNPIQYMFSSIVFLISTSRWPLDALLAVCQDKFLKP